MKVVENGSWFCFFKYSFLEKIEHLQAYGYLQNTYIFWFTGLWHPKNYKNHSF